MYLKKKKISVVGAGLVGSLWSLYLKKQGAEVSVFEKRSDLRLDQNIAGRSINLALSERGINALRKVGVAKSIMKIAMPMYKRIIHLENGSVQEQYYGKKNQAIYSVSRKDLNIKLIDIAESKSVNFFFNKTCDDIDFNNTQLSFINHSPVESDFIFGADGAGSIIRKTMESKLSKNQNFNIKENFIDHGYKELTIPVNLDGTHKLENDALHIWPRKSYMIIALPNLDGTFTCTLFLPMKGEKSFESIVTQSDVDDFFSKEFNDIKKLLPDLMNQYFKNPIASLGFVRCDVWRQNNTFLIGDACHATVPFYGQGMNAGFEDCFLLDNWINTQYKQFPNEEVNVWRDKMTTFLRHRNIDTRAMQDLSMMNFIEMRAETADLIFLLQKKIEKWFAEKHPEKWTPLYSMVTFSHIGYNDALKRGVQQDDIMKKIMKRNQLNSAFDIQDLEIKNVEQQILHELNKSNL